MEPKYQNWDKVILHPNHLWMEQGQDLTLFTMTNWSLELSSRTRPWGETGTGMQMTLVLKRKIMNEMMTTYLPTFLLMIITYATTFFKPIYFEAALSVNLTTMLVMTTIFIGVMDSLPTTAYVKMIDIWLIFCQLVPFAEVVLLTTMEYLREEEEQGKEENEEVNQAFHEQDIITVESLHNKESNVFQVKVKTGTAAGKKNKLASTNTLKTIGLKKSIISQTYIIFFQKRCFCL